MPDNSISTLSDAITQFAGIVPKIAAEQSQLDVFVNGDESATYTASDGRTVKSLAGVVVDVSNTALAGAESVVEDTIQKNLASTVSQAEAFAVAAAASYGGTMTFLAVPSSYSGTTPVGVTLVKADSTGLVTINMAPGQNIVQVMLGGVGTLKLVANALPFSLDLVDKDGGLSSVAIQQV